ncbi:unnamed protein product [Calypogeia fissa]
MDPTDYNYVDPPSSSYNVGDVVQSQVPNGPQNPFVPERAKEIIGAVLHEKLTGVRYNSESAPLYVRDITDAIKSQLKDLGLDRYKIVVQAMLGEQKGQGFQMSCRCFWDPNTDNYAHDSFSNESIFCVAGAFALYMS